MEIHTLGVNNQGLRFLSLETCDQLARPNMVMYFQATTVNESVALNKGFLPLLINK